MRQIKIKSDRTVSDDSIFKNHGDHGTGASFMSFEVVNNMPANRSGSWRHHEQEIHLLQQCSSGIQPG